MSADKISDPRQLLLFPELTVDDPLLTYYRKLRGISAVLSLNIADDRILVYRDDGIPAWAVRAIPPLHDRIRADLLRVEHGIEEQAAPEHLDGGAVLHRLPPRRSPELEPPVRQRTPRNRRGPGAA
jgi:hypothetical protein